MPINNDEMKTWVNTKLKPWARKATEIYCEKGEVPEDRLSEIVNLCLEPDDTIEISEFDLGISSGTQDNYALRELTEVVGVNALDQVRPLKFNPQGLTVIYGENGTGKSGYIRILKKISSLRMKDKILGNINEPEENHVSPKCKVMIDINGVTVDPLECDLSGQPEHEILKGIDVFDTAVSEAYISESQAASFQPTTVRYLKYLLEKLQPAIQKILEERKAEINIPNNPLSSKYSTTRAYKYFEGLAKESTGEEIAEEWDKEPELQALQNKANISSITAKIRELDNKERDAKRFLVIFQECQKYFSEEYTRLLSLVEKYKEVCQTEEESEKIYSDCFDDADKVCLSENKEVLRTLWKFARQYYSLYLEEQNGIKFGEEKSLCPLCKRPLDKEGSHRFIGIDKYVSGEIAKAKKVAFENILVNIGRLSMSVDRESLKTFLENNLNDGLETTLAVYDSIKQWIADAQNAQWDKVVDLSTDIAVVIEKITTFLNSISQELSQTKMLINGEEQVVLQTQINELIAEKELIENKQLILEKISKLKQIQAIDTAAEQIKTNTISTKLKEVIESEIAANYKDKFEDELRRLTGGRLKAYIDDSKKKGKETAFTVGIRDVNGNWVKEDTKLIFSEGENRVASIAAFLAESSARGTSTPLVFDDPISSLDFKYEKAVIKRLVELSLERQVIVFTHRLSLLVGLYNAMSEYVSNQKGSDSELKMEDMFLEETICSEGDVKGVVSTISNVDNEDVIRALFGLIDKDIPHLEELLKDKRNLGTREEKREKEWLCMQFRNLIEKSVQSILLCDIVDRYRVNIYMQGPRYLALSGINKDETDAILKMLEEYSYPDHSQPFDAPYMLYSVDKIKNDIIETELRLCEMVDRRNAAGMKIKTLGQKDKKKLEDMYNSIIASR